MTEDDAATYYPSLVWTGSEYGIAFEDERDGDGSSSEIYFARLDADGNQIGTDIRVTNNAAFSYTPSLVWTGTGYGLAWVDERDGGSEIYFALLNAAGEKISIDIRVTIDAALSYLPYLVWTGTEFGIAWSDERDGEGASSEIYFVRLDGKGDKIGKDLLITSPLSFSVAPWLVWTGKEYGIVWFDDRDAKGIYDWDIYFVRLTATGGRIGNDIRVSSAQYESWWPSLVWTGTEYGVAWMDYRDELWTIYLARLDDEGTKLADEVPISSEGVDSFFPSLVWNGAEYGLAWDDNTLNQEVDFARIDAAGNRIGLPIGVSDAEGLSGLADLVWNGDGYAVAWLDDRDKNTEVYGAGISCGASATLGDDLLVNFGPGDGLWIYANNSSWTPLLSASPEITLAADLDGNGIDEVIVDLGVDGIWIYDNGESWRWLHELSPDKLGSADFDGDGDAELVVDFGKGLGLWIYDNSSGWRQLHDLSPKSFTPGDFNGSGQDDLLVDFGPGTGVWVYVDDTFWLFLHDLSPDSFTVANLNGNESDDLVIDFGPKYGVYIFYDGTSWYWLHELSPVAIEAGDIDSSGIDELIVNFGDPNGVWIYQNNESWSWLHGLSPEFIRVADINSNGYADLVVDFGPANGLWVYGDGDGWFFLHGTSPVDVTAASLYGPPVGAAFSVIGTPQAPPFGGLRPSNLDTLLGPPDSRPAGTNRWVAPPGTVGPQLNSVRDGWRGQIGTVRKP